MKAFTVAFNRSRIPTPLDAWRWSTLRSLALAVLFVSSLAACGGSSPQSSLDAYAKALSASDAKRAYALLDPKLQEQLPFDDFKKAFDGFASPSSVEALKRASAEAAYIDARLPLDEFDEVELSLSSSGWQVEKGLFNFYAQRTPRESLLSFLAAAEAQKYELILRFVPAAYAAHMDENTIRRQFESNPAETSEMLTLLRQNQHNLIKTQGSRAWMPYGRFRVDFVKEDGLWKIEDLD